MRSPVVLGAVAGAVVALVVLAVVVLLAAELAPPPRGVAASPQGSAAAPAAGSLPASGSPVGAAAATGGSTAGSTSSRATGSHAAAPSTSSPPVGLAVGDQAPPLSLQRLGGGTVDLASLRGRPVWVNFIATWCPDCRDELPIMEAYASQLGDRMSIVLVDVREDPATVSAFAGQLRLDLPIGLDGAGTAQRAWSAYALPVHFWLDAGGIVRSVGFGELGPPQFHASVSRVLPGASLYP
jgi:cytochrome c biogenesis protein CcmG, thiol:disulfide interchange protein DsbE